MTVERCSFPPETASVAAARRYVEQVLEAWLVQDAGWTCLQLVSELATNAVIHARTEFVLEVTRHDHRLRVCVHDSSPAAPGVRRYAADATTGRGLRLVESMSTEWGVATTSFGKTIWFEIDLSQPATAQSWDDGDDVDLDLLLSQFDDDEGGAVTHARTGHGHRAATRRKQEAA